jgi:integrase
MANMNDITIRYFPKSADRPTLIQAILQFSGIRFKYSFGLTIGPDDKWDSKKHQFKNNSKKQEILDGYTAAFKKAYRDDISPEDLRAKMEEYKKGNQIPKPAMPDTPGKTKFYDLFKEIALRRKKEETQKNILAVRKRMMEKWPEFNFSKMNTQWLEEYRNWLKEENKDIKTTTVNAYLNIIKQVVKSAAKYIKENPFDKFEMEEPDEADSDAIALTKQELQMLVKWKPTSKRFERVRDCFLVGAFTGLRSKDLRQLNISNVVGGHTLKVKTSKKGKLFEMPVPFVVKEILRKYNGFPKFPASTQFNTDIKEVCRLAGLTEKGALSTDTSKEVWECVQVHTARRTFITIALHDDHVPTDTVMKWTTHKKPEMLHAYAKQRIKNSSLVAIERDKEWEAFN